MNKSPAIVMTRLDVQRLEKVLDNMQAPLDLLEALEDEGLQKGCGSSTLARSIGGLRLRYKPDTGQGDKIVDW